MSLGRTRNWTRGLFETVCNAVPCCTVFFKMVFAGAEWKEIQGSCHCSGIRIGGWAYPLKLRDKHLFSKPELYISHMLGQTLSAKYLQLSLDQELFLPPPSFFSNFQGLQILLVPENETDLDLRSETMASGHDHVSFTIAEPSESTMNSSQPCWHPKKCFDFYHVGIQISWRNKIFGLTDWLAGLFSLHGPRPWRKRLFTCWHLSRFKTNSEEASLISGQIKLSRIPHTGPSGLVREIPLFQGNLYRLVKYYNSMGGEKCCLPTTF